MENQRPKLELPINSPQLLELAFDNPITGESKYGPYYCYTFKDSRKNEFSFFAPEKIHAVLKDQIKGAKIKLVKTAVEKNKKLIQDYSVEVISTGKVNGNGIYTEHDQNNDPPTDKKEMSPLALMRQCFADATELQKEYNSVNINQVSITLYISISKLSGNGFKEVL